MIEYIASIEWTGYLLDELDILMAARCIGKHVGIMLDVLEFWMTRRHNKW